jgi:hypothetical protein
MNEVATGTQTAVITTEHTLDTETNAETYMLAVDLSEMVSGDVVEIRAKIKVLSGSVERLYAMTTIAGVQVAPAWISLPVPSAHSVKFTLTQTAGTGRDYDWAVWTA